MNRQPMPTVAPTPPPPMREGCSGPTIEDLIEQGYLTPTGRYRPSPSMRFGQLLNSAFSKSRKIGKVPELGMPFNRCPDLSTIYGADIYTRGALEVQASTIVGLKESLASAHRSTARYMALALLGWAAVVVMGVVL